MSRKTINERFESHVAPPNENGCELWTGYIGSGGYGSFRIDGQRFGAHRIAYELEHGPFDQSMWVLHTCDVRACVNPEHLYLGTPSDNSMDCVERGRHPGKEATHCENGHEYTSENIYMLRGKRYCRQCRYERSHEYTIRQRDRQ